MADRGRRETFEVSGDDKKSSGTSANTEKIQQELDRLAKKGQVTAADISDLYNKYDEEVAEEILRRDAKRGIQVRKQAKKIAQKIYKKYSDGSRPLHEILDRMMRFKIENKWSDSVYDEFRKELSYLLTGNRAMEIDLNQNIVAQRSRINRALGNTRVTVEDGLRIKDSEQGIKGEILSMYEKTSSLHKSVFMHSLMYEDCSLTAMTGEYKRERHIAGNHIHPLLACMFLPKIDIFEIQMLYSNFGSIIKARDERKPIVTEPDFMLFDAITTDPNDVVCEVNSPLTDIRNRYKVQIALWQTVLKLRSGSYYETEPISEFMTTLNACRNNLYDNADLAYNQDEGAMLRRLLSVFSLRPTIIYTKPIYSVASFAAGPFAMSMGAEYGAGAAAGQGMFPFSGQPVYTITSVPMITLQIPPYTSDNDEPKDLRASTQQTIWINENKMIIPKQQSIIYSKEVLIFYVNRRIQRIQIKTFSNPLTFSQLPLTMSSFERLNAYPVYVPDRISLRSAEETYHLRSVVAVTETEIKQGDKTTNIITGSTGLIMKHRDLGNSLFEPRYYIYDPFGASLPRKHPESGSEYDGYFANKPISFIEPIFTPPPEATGGIINLSFADRAQRNGTIFIYAKPGGFSNTREIISL